MKWLVTAFEPFAQATTNSSLLVVRELEKMDWQGQVQFLYPLPVTFKNAWTVVHEVLGRSPEVGGVLAFGQAETRSRVSLERVGLNWMDARIPDNAGDQPLQRKIQAGPDMYWSGIPWDRFPVYPDVELSYSAGTYVCNMLMFLSLDWGVQSGKLAGFVHVPVLSSQRASEFPVSPRMDAGRALKISQEIINFALELKRP